MRLCTPRQDRLLPSRRWGMRLAAQHADEWFPIDAASVQPGDAALIAARRAMAVERKNAALPERDGAAPNGPRHRGTVPVRGGGQLRVAIPDGDEAVPSVRVAPRRVVVFEVLLAVGRRA